MMFRERIAVCSESYSEHIKTLFLQYVVFLILKQVDLHTLISTEILYYHA
jgi:hypothetical protein